MSAAAPAAGHLLHAAAVLHPPRAASLRRFLAFACAGLGTPLCLDRLERRRRDWLAEPIAGDPSAARRLAAEDLAPILAAAPAVARRIAAWAEPEAALAQALAAILDRLRALGIDAEAPALHLVDGLPAPWNFPALAGANYGRIDGEHFGHAVGIHLDRRRLAPFFSELTLGHVLVHHLLAVRSPGSIGRGLEEGVAEVLGGLHAAAAAAGADAVRALFAAYRLTPALHPRREELLERVRGAALLHRRHGIGGLAALVCAGRDAVKQAEAALAALRPEAVDLPLGPPDPELAASLDALLAGGRPLAVGPLAYLLAPALARGLSLERADDEIGVAREPALAAARELMERAFVVVLGPSGEVLADDLELVLGSRELRYELPPVTPAVPDGAGSR